MALTLVQSIRTDTSSGTSISATFPGAVTSDNLLIAAFAGDKNSGTITGPSGFTPIANLKSASVSLWVGYKVATGSETQLTVSHTTTANNGDTLWIAEYSSDQIGDWTILGSATNITDEATTSSWSSGTTAAIPNPGSALAFFAIDSGSSAQGTISYTNSFTGIVTPLSNFAGNIMVAFRSGISASTAVETTQTHGATNDQKSGAVLVFERVSSTTSITPNSLLSDTNISRPTVISAGGAVPNSLISDVNISSPTTGYIPLNPPIQETFSPPFRPARIRSVESHHIKIIPRFLLLDHHDNILDDITPRVSGCRIEHGGFRNIHRTIELDIAFELEWGRQRIKPFVKLETPDGDTDFIPLGVFLLTIPEENIGSSPIVYSVSGFDKTYILDQALAGSFTATEGDLILDKVRQMLFARNIPINAISTVSEAEVMANTRTWSVTEDIKDLNVINDLLGMVNYRGLYMTPDGLPKSEKYIPPGQQAVMWTYNSEDKNTTVKRHRTKRHDYTDVPNRWVFWIQNLEEEEIPEIGKGIYVFDNINDGPSSQIQRGDLVITRKEGLEVNSQEALEEAALRRIGEDIQSQTYLTIQTSINPHHGHFDVMEIIDPPGGIYGRFQHISWKLDLWTGTMEHELRSVDVI